MKRLNRRRFLLGAAGAAVLVPVSYALRMNFGGYEGPASLRYITAKEAAIAWAMVETVIPKENVFGIPPDREKSVRSMDRLLDGFTEMARSEIRLLLWTVEHVFPIVGLRFSKFTDLSIENRRAILSRLESGPGPSRLLVRAVKTVGNMAYFSEPEVHAKLGHGGWCGA